MTPRLAIRRGGQASHATAPRAGIGAETGAGWFGSRGCDPRRLRIEQLGWIEQRPATIALTAARRLVSTMWADANDVAVREEAPILARPHLLNFALFYEPRRSKSSIEVLRQCMVLWRRRAPEV